MPDALRLLFPQPFNAHSHDPSAPSPKRAASFTPLPMSHPIFQSLALLCVANVFMTFAWYGHLKSLSAQPLWVIILTSWGIAFFEYCFQVPANRIGYTAMTLGQLKVSQELITMCVFMVFSVVYMKKPLSLDLLYATLCLVLAAYFVFRSPTT